MLTEKEIKKEFKIKAQKNPEEYYPVKILKEEGFIRKKCVKCRNHFWSASDRAVCGEPECSGGYLFIGNSPAKKKMDFIQTWQQFSKLFERLGYVSIPRYPVVARWRDDTDFVQASIYDFQPYCVSGEIDPPANPLVVPQFCLRFNDTDNVGITGRHYTGFVMIGQHTFQTPEDYKPDDYLKHIYTWLIEGMKIPKEEVQFHEDAWAGGGNMGPSMEFFSCGLEIGNQVYMQYDIKTGVAKELSIKVLDMGMGQERPAWFTQGTGTSYDAVFPPVVKRLYAITGVKPDQELMRKFLPYSGLLSIDETELDKIWEEIATKINEDVDTLKENILPLSGIYSIGDHTRSLLIALSDGALPSNVGGGYNLRVLVRRSLDFITRYGWDISLPEVCEWHARYLKPQYPELMEHLDGVRRILDVEREKYKETKKKSRRIVTSLKGKEVSLDKLIELYDSHGISPEMLKKRGLEIDIPVDFYIQVSERHEKKEQQAQTPKFKLDLTGIDKTDILYYDDYALLEFKARVLKIIDNNYVILDKTAFYPTSGGQLADKGFMDSSEVVNVFKQGNVIVHRVKNPDFKEGETISCRIDRDRRIQLAQHHTATHIINGVAREILGEHIWQAGAEKTLEKARLDITHYESLNDEQLEEINKRANEVVQKGLNVESMVLKRDIAERRYGFRLYQGGAVPGKELRVVKIGDLDVEACGGTHLKSTKGIGYIHIIGSTKIQDGVVRLEYVAGEAAKRYKEEKRREWKGIIGSATAVMNEWKIRDEREFQKIIEELKASAHVFSVPIDQLNRTLTRFLEELKEDHKEINRIRKSLGRDELQKKEALARDLSLSEFSEIVLNRWKEQRKELEKLKGELVKKKKEKLRSKIEKIGKYEFLLAEIKAGMNETQKTAQELIRDNKIVVIFGIDEKVSVVGIRGKDVPVDMGKIITQTCNILGGGGGGKPDFARGAGVNKEKIEEAKEWVRKHITILLAREE